MEELGALVKNRRLAHGWTLRQLATEIGVTPAYVSDIEANRRLPSDELKKRICSVLKIPPEELAAVDYRLSPDLQTWIEERPQLTSLLRSLRASPQSEMLVQRLSKIINKRAQPKAARGFLVTWESELRAIAAEASAWSVETGGDLFGRWHDVPTIFLATKAGPNAQRNHAHFRLDVDYLRHLGESMASDWDLRYFGDWHSHHRLGLTSPSSGDRRRIYSIAGRNQFRGIAEIIVTLDDGRGDPTVRIHPWIYDLSGQDTEPHPLRVKVLPGLSPIRQALLARRLLPEQEFFAWEKVALQRIRIGSDAVPPIVEASGDADSTTRERTLSHLAEALQSASGTPVEHHSTGFGSVLVARLNEPYYLAFALGSAWPMAVLEVHRLNRRDSSTEPINVPAGLIAPDIQGILEIFRSVKEKGTKHVER